MAGDNYGRYEFEILEGWRVVNDNFYKIDPSDNLSDDDKFNYIFCLEDMLLIENDEFHIDLGWYGGEDGRYIIHFFKGTWLVGELLEKFSSNKSLQIANRINEILSAFKSGDFESVKGYKVDGNDLSNQSDFGDLNNFEPRKK